MKAKFKIGDRVRCIEENIWVHIDATGTVTELDDCPYIKLDDVSMSKHGSDVMAVYQGSLELIKNKVEEIND